MQGNLESLMDTAVEKSGGQQLSATLMDAHTGDILATTQRPTITANNFNDKAARNSHISQRTACFTSHNLNLVLL